MQTWHSLGLNPQPTHTEEGIPFTTMLGTQVDLTRVELEGVLPSATIMVVTVTASTTAGLPLSENAVTKVCKPS